MPEALAGSSGSRRARRRAHRARESRGRAMDRHVQPEAVRARPGRWKFIGLLTDGSVFLPPEDGSHRMFLRTHLPPVSGSYRALAFLYSNVASAFRRKGGAAQKRLTAKRADNLSFNSACSASSAVKSSWTATSDRFACPGYWPAARLNAAVPPTTGSRSEVRLKSIVSSVPGLGQSVKSRSLEKITTPMRLPAGMI